MTAHHTRAITASFPTGVPISSPRIVSVTGVNGWYVANCARPGAIESVGTKPEGHRIPRFVRSSSQFVLTDEPAQHARRSDPWSVARPPSPIRPRLRRPQLEAPMGPGPVVVGDVCAKHMLE